MWWRLAPWKFPPLDEVYRLQQMYEFAATRGNTFALEDTQRYPDFSAGPVTVAKCTNCCSSLTPPSLGFVKAFTKKNLRERRPLNKTKVFLKKWLRETKQTISFTCIWQLALLTKI